MSGSTDPQLEELRAGGGQPARALISGAKAGKKVKNTDDVMWKVSLRVMPDAADPFNTVIQVPYPAKAGGPAIGSMIGVLYDPKHTGKVAIDPSVATESWGSVQQKTINQIVSQVPNPASGLIIAGGQVIAGGQQLSPAAATTPATTTPSVAEELERLADLKARGVLSDAEFQAQKQKLLGS
jgi:hypothetical protein